MSIMATPRGGRVGGIEEAGKQLVVALRTGGA